MISVLIADDEYLIRRLICNSIDWAELGLEVIGEAGDGEEALAFIREKQPQIALVDINMPMMNGLELARQVQEEKLPANIVFLTGYREFEYAKQAVTCHAFDFLLKPIAKEELTRVLSQLIQKINMEEQLSRQARTSETEKTRGEQLAQTQFLHRLALSRSFRMDEEKIQAELERLGITLSEQNLLPLVIEIETQDAKWNDGLYIYAVLNILTELMEGDGGFANIYEMSEIDSCAIVICNVLDPLRYEERIQSIWEKMTALVHAHFPFVLTGGLGSLLQGFTQVGEGVQTAMGALSGRFYCPEENRLFSAAPRRSSLNPLSIANFEELQLCIDAEEWEDGRQIVAALFRQMREERVHESMYRMAALGLVAIFYSLAAKYKLPAEVIQGGSESISDRIDDSGDCYETEDLLTGCYDRLVAALQKARQVSKHVYAAQEYIKQHYMESDLSLKKLSAAIFASPAYISSLFKAELGTSITEYITVCRMKKAAELLKGDPEINLASVSEQVGYTDPYYFSRCFKKYYNVTPSKFIAGHL